jgi:lysozyme
MKLSNLQLFVLIAAVLVVAKFRGAIGGALSDLIKRFEGVRLQAYQDSAGVWSIGYGLIRYPDGSPVMPGDTITQAQADAYFMTILNRFAQGVEDLLTVPVNENQFSALVSLAYNIGLSAFANSTLLDLVNQNPNDPAIRSQFMRWVYAGGQVVQGLVNRRTDEANLYFTR